jgi:ubiquinone/menaquinone biosynthesis C-methylase UbiE
MTTRGKSRPAADLLALWHTLQRSGVLQCPVCGGALTVMDELFECVSCSSAFPVEDGVPMLTRPADMVSIPDHVMDVFKIPLVYKERVEAALATITKYRMPLYPEFSNFFARFEGRDVQMQPVPLSPEDTGAAIERVECLSCYFSKEMCSGETEFRSIRIRNASDRILFTDERNPLHLSYRVFTIRGELIPFEGNRSQLPCPLRPGAELTIPVMFGLPRGLTGQFIVRFYFLLEHVRWFDKCPVAEMIVTMTDRNEEFPATRRNSVQEFDVQEDVVRGDDFFSRVLSDLRSCGIPKPRILEIGAGVYPISLRACIGNGTVVVSDISLVMQRLASIVHADHPAVMEGRAAFASIDAMHPPFQAESFDIICMSAALHHIAFPDEFLKGLARMLSCHGRFVAVREPCLVNPFEPEYIVELANGFNEQMFELSEWREIITRGGLTLDRAVIDFGCSLKFSARLPHAPRQCI